MAKDTEKLIRQLSLLSYLMTERRAVTALQIRRDVEGYSAMNEGAFARRFYADRTELEALGIGLTVERPFDGVAEAEQYSLRPEQFHLPAITFTDTELAGLQTALALLDREFAYAEPLRLALQQLCWGRANPLRAPEQRAVGLAVKAAPGGRDMSRHLAKIELAISRHKTLTFDYYSITRGTIEARTVDPYHLLFQGGEFCVLGRCRGRDAIRAFRVSRIRGIVRYATKAEHDFKGRPASFDPRAYANRAGWQIGDRTATAEIWISERIAWQIERHFGRYGTVRSEEGSGDITFATWYADPRQIAAWVLPLGEHARVLGPPDLVEEITGRVEILDARHRHPALELADPVDAELEAEPDADEWPRGVDMQIRSERLARLVTLASILIQAGRAGTPLDGRELCGRLQLSDAELREDVSVLNVVNFGGGSYVLYAEIDADGLIHVDPEPYADAFARPARLLEVEAKALVAAIDLVGDHLPEGSLQSAREKIVAAMGADPIERGLQVAATGADDSQIARVASQAIREQRLLRLEYYKPNEDQYTTRIVEPYALVSGREGWYVASFDPDRDDVRHFRLDRILNAQITTQTFTPRPDVNPAAQLDGWLRTGEVQQSRIALVWISPERARWAREERRVTQNLADGAVIIEVPFKGTDFLVRDILAEAGDAAVLEPADARDAVRAAAGRLLAGALPA